MLCLENTPTSFTCQPCFGLRPRLPDLCYAANSPSSAMDLIKYAYNVIINFHSFIQNSIFWQAKIKQPIYFCLGSPGKHVNRCCFSFYQSFKRMVNKRKPPPVPIDRIQACSPFVVATYGGVHLHIYHLQPIAYDSYFTQLHFHSYLLCNWEVPLKYDSSIFNTKVKLHLYFSDCFELTGF